MDIANFCGILTYGERKTYIRVAVKLVNEEVMERKKMDLQKTLDEISAKWESDQIDCVLGGVFSIKKYYMESGNPRQMRGASQLIADSFQSDIIDKKLEALGGCRCFFVIMHHLHLQNRNICK